MRELNETELMHYKYVKRVKVNGKWRYYYDDSEYKDKKKRYQNSKKKLDAAENATYAAQQEEKQAYVNAKTAFNYPEGETDKDEYLFDRIIATRAAECREAEAGREYISSKQLYMRAKVSHVPTAVVSKGMVAVGNVISAISSLAKKLKKKVKAKLKK